ncbi:MAG: deoxyguanosinetriphosphate triphosphohydrolase [Alphaproteobacteria bacterium]|jgi:dGTPase|nr:deoxyguanosinetriphosphate triphosphohydrolase [Alphaproteobacteria bacterium]MBT4710034.1 deoxyguanosinetriphosphate triphosphohydrolase [Alphaproteobacteria bacterium]MBT5860557.1 deoxyguanosinetriphosphate triphosphohydrolase [Alphaproteobacteria bacterium]
MSGAIFASRATQSRGRLFEEPPSPTRSDFQRDRDRIIHCAAFRRLQHKTQVFVHHEGDHYRSRLTHSLEVAQIARSVARELGLEEDLAEAMALAHDLGHPPFGHAGEDALDAVMADFGGFDHNAQALRILTHLERRYADFDGLNLTWESLEGIAKHNGPVLPPLPAALLEYGVQQDLELDTYAGPEAQVAALADDIAYNNHDIDDGVRAGLFTLDDLADVPLVGPILAQVHETHPNLPQSQLIFEAVRRMINLMVSDLVAQTRRNVAAATPLGVDEVRALGRPLAAFSDGLLADEKILRGFLLKNMYRHERVNRMSEQGRGIVSDLFRFYLDNPSRLPEDWRPMDNEARDPQTLARTIADFIAGMTDRYAMKAHEELIVKS